MYINLVSHNIEDDFFEHKPNTYVAKDQTKNTTIYPTH